MGFIDLTANSLNKSF